jgi:hypothetical protein
MSQCLDAAHGPYRPRGFPPNGTPYWGNTCTTAGTTGYDVTWKILPNKIIATNCNVHGCMCDECKKNKERPPEEPPATPTKKKKK